MWFVSESSQGNACRWAMHQGRSGPKSGVAWGEGCASAERPKNVLASPSGVRGGTLVGFPPGQFHISPSWWWRRCRAQPGCCWDLCWVMGSPCPMGWWSERTPGCHPPSPNSSVLVFWRVLVPVCKSRPGDGREGRGDIAHPCPGLGVWPSLSPTGLPKLSTGSPRSWK